MAGRGRKEGLGSGEGVGGGGGGGVFFFKQKTAYEILTCDWSSDVCSSDLKVHAKKKSNIQNIQLLDLSLMSKLQVKRVIKV